MSETDEKKSLIKTSEQLKEQQSPSFLEKKLREMKFLEQHNLQARIIPADETRGISDAAKAVKRRLGL